MRNRTRRSTTGFVSLLLILVGTACLPQGNSEDEVPRVVSSTDTSESSTGGGSTDTATTETETRDAGPDGSADVDSGPSGDVYQGPDRVSKPISDRYSLPPEDPVTCNSFCQERDYRCDTDRALQDPEVEYVGEASYLEEGKLRPDSQADLVYRESTACSEEFQPKVDEWGDIHELYILTCQCIAPVERTYSVDFDDPKTCKEICRSKGLYCDTEESWGDMTSSTGATLVKCRRDEDPNDGSFELERWVSSCDSKPVEKGEDPGCITDVRCRCTTEK